jgi:hypothetical protein
MTGLIDGPALKSFRPSARVPKDLHYKTGRRLKRGICAKCSAGTHADCNSLNCRCKHPSHSGEIR